MLDIFFVMAAFLSCGKMVVNVVIARAVLVVIIDDAAGLQVGIDGCGA